MVFVMENDTCGTQEWTISNVAIWRGRGSSSGHSVMMSKCNHGFELDAVVHVWLGGLQRFPRSSSLGCPILFGTE